MSLDTLANVKARLGISSSSDDTLLGLLMDSADDWVANQTGRDFAGGTYTEFFPGHAELLILANFPVASVTSVKVDPAGAYGSDTLIDSTNYAVHSERGVIQSKVGPLGCRGPRVVQVVYTTATSAVPDDVKEAYARLVGHWYAHVKTESAAGFEHVAEQKYGDVTTRYELAALAVPPEVGRLLAPYRTPNI
jgi:uncharacterized phiE125 gp8 family phage protein